MRRVALAALAMCSGCSAAPGALWRTHAAMSSLELKIPPPVVALFFALCMWLASSLVAPLELPFVLCVGAALTLVAVGLVVSTAGVVSFRRARTTINPTKPMATSALVSGGIYRITRNPMYLGLLLELLGWAAFLANPLALLLVPAFVLYINRFQIKPEERTLSALFGGEYGAYQERVRRWL
jgi:protein-S-isoprenylcysteine O-methyltransferase Ste14